MSLSLGAIADTRNQTAKARIMEKVVMLSVRQAIALSQLASSSGFQPCSTRPEVSTDMWASFPC